MTNEHQDVNYTRLNADKFKRCRVSINFIWESQRDTATAAALLAYLMQRGYSEYPDMTQLSKHLAKLYSAYLSVDTTVCGAARVLSVAVTGLKSEYALEGEDLAAEYAHIAAGVAFAPHLVDGLFCKESLDIEREKLRSALEGEMNEKRVYCVKQARRKFFGDAKEGIERSGYLDDIDAVSPLSITEVYHHMISTARIEVLSFGMDDTLVKHEISRLITNVKREVNVPTLISAQKSHPVSDYVQHIDAVQGKLCLLFTTNTPIMQEDTAAMQMAVALLGGTPTSRLFTNVREKESLCYYCAAGFSRFTGMLSIDSGIEPVNAVKAKLAILRELEALKTGEITTKELSDTQKCLVNNLRSVSDSLVSLDGWTFTELISGAGRSADMAIEQVQRVSIQDIKRMLSCLELSVTYLLTKGES